MSLTLGPCLTSFIPTAGSSDGDKHQCHAQPEHVLKRLPFKGQHMFVGNMQQPLPPLNIVKVKKGTCIQVQLTAMLLGEKW